MFIWVVKANFRDRQHFLQSLRDLDGELLYFMCALKATFDVIVTRTRKKWSTIMTYARGNN